MRTAIVIHGLADARAALAAGDALRLPVTLISGPGGGSYAGPAWFNEVVRAASAEFPQVAVTAILDCDDAPGHALGAFRAGVKAVRFTGREDVAEKLRDIAASLDAELITDEVETLDLRAHRDPVAACTSWLNAHVAA